MSTESQPARLPSFSLVLTTADENDAAVEIFALKDSNRASRREVHLNLVWPPQANAVTRTGLQSGGPQPRDDDPLMRTVDTRFTGSLAYDVDYLPTIEEEEDLKTEVAHVHVREANETSSSSSIASSWASGSSEDHDEDDAASSASTSEIDLNREFESEWGQEIETECSTVSEADDTDDVGRIAPLHRHPISLVQPGPFPVPKYNSEGIPSSSKLARVLGTSEEGSGHPRPRSRSQSSSRIWQRGLVFMLLRILESLWRRLKMVAGKVVHEFTKDL